MKAVVCFAATMLMVPMTASAVVVNLFSSTSTQVIPNGGSLQNSVVITPHPYWQNPANPPVSGNGAWISYADTGDGGSSPANVPGFTEAALNAAPATAVFYHAFQLQGSDNTGQLRVWADDTARVELWNTGSNSLVTGAPLKLANPFQDGACAFGSIGCEPLEFALFTFGPGNLSLSSGNYELRIHSYQRAGGPFGILYSGSISSVPEPGFYGLLGLGLSGLYLIVYRRRAGAKA